MHVSIEPLYIKPDLFVAKMSVVSMFLSRTLIEFLIQSLATFSILIKFHFPFLVRLD